MARVGYKKAKCSTSSRNKDGDSCGKGQGCKSGRFSEGSRPFLQCQIPSSAASVPSP